MLGIGRLPRQPTARPRRSGRPALAAGGFAKGVVGFALPLIGLSLAGSFVPYEVAVALLIVPMLVSNLFQALRQGLGAGARDAAAASGWLNLVLVVMIALAAQLVVALPDRLLFGHPRGRGLGVRRQPARRLAAAVPDRGTGPRSRSAWRSSAGFFGGLSGIWGPPIVMYLLAAGLPKVEMVRAQSLSFLLGSLVLLARAPALGRARTRSRCRPRRGWCCRRWRRCSSATGCTTGWTSDASARLTLAVLVLTGLNLLRRGAVLSAEMPARFPRPAILR